MTKTKPGQENNKFPIKGYLLIISTAFFTAVSYVCGKYVDKDLAPDTITFFWFFGAFFFAVFAILLIPNQRLELKNLKKYTKIFIWSSIVTSLGAAFWIFSIRSIGLPLTSFLMKAQTIFSLFLGIAFLGERLNKGETAGVIITLGGAAIVVYQKEFDLIVGTLTALLSAFLYSFLAFLIKRIAQNLNMLTVANLRALGVSIIVFIFLMVTDRFVMPSFIDIVFMALGGLSGAYIAKASQFQAIKLLDVSRSTAVMPLESIFVIAFSFLIFNELPTPIKLFGGFLIVSGVVLLVIFRGEQNGISKTSISSTEVLAGREKPQN